MGKIEKIQTSQKNGVGSNPPTVKPRPQYKPNSGGNSEN